MASGYGTVEVVAVAGVVAVLENVEPSPVWTEPSLPAETTSRNTANKISKTAPISM